MKCQSCPHYVQPFIEKGPFDALCGHTTIHEIADPDYENHFKIEIEVAREICDREGDGIFVYFEPRTDEETQ